MNILFWNTGKRPNTKVIEQLLNEYHIDIALFAEYTSLGIDSVIQDCDDEYVWHDGNGGCEKITLIAKKDIKVSVVREHARFTIYRCNSGTTQYIIIGAHLLDRIHHRQISRMVPINALNEFALETEKNAGHDRTIIIGDLNLNPFEEEVIGKPGLNAVLFRSLIDKQEIIQYCGKRYKRFYNPILTYWRDEIGKQGSIYYGSDEASLYWNCFDQVLMRRSVVPQYKSMEYVTQTTKTKLLANIGPDKRYSDHLPLVVYFNEEV